MNHTPSEVGPSKVGVCLVAEARDGAPWRDRIGAALDATQARTLILMLPDADTPDLAAVRALVERAQARNVAALVANDVATAQATGADGVHLAWRPEIEDAYEAARSTLGPDAIVGADAGASRHDAMTLGEAGADYVAFGKGSAALGGDNDARTTQHDLVAWWSDVFLIPVVAFDAETAGDVAGAVRAGADFVAVRLPEPGAEADQAAADAAWADGLRTALRAPADAA